MATQNAKLENSSSYTIVKHRNVEFYETDPIEIENPNIIPNIPAKGVNSTTQGYALENSYSRDPNLKPTISYEQATIYKDNVNGTVLYTEAESVHCELYLRNKNVEINLPKSFFPENPVIGFPINLSFDDSSGIRKPVIKKRLVSEESKKSGLKEFSEMVKKLSE